MLILFSNFVVKLLWVYLLKRQEFIKMCGLCGKVLIKVHLL